ncbi:MAG TPA: hypothetical protein VFC38_09060 [Stellaceae bacterium]|nr:hypothetical protein [Stellaceae bacterium]
MAISASPIPPRLKTEIEKIAVALHRSIVATLTAAVVASRDRPRSLGGAPGIGRGPWRPKS